ncbi:hypothetical protein HDU85_002352 [Gaertneriomyces sp. JEL0708]|nr:hypothetical protein HDU85_002352 [Gaertneriomyces sp. JEL0708]
MISTNKRIGKRETRTKATFQATRKTAARPEEDTPTVRQRLSEARKSGVLDLRGLGLSNIPVDAERLTSLAALLLGDNKFTAIPNDLPKLFPNLSFLDFSNNRVPVIPNTVAELADLQLLDVESNPELPETIPAPFTPLLDQGRLAIFIGSPDVSDVGDDESADSGNDDDRAMQVDGSEDDQEEEEASWRKDYYDTDDEGEYDELETEEGGYESDNDTTDASGQESVERQQGPLPTTGLNKEFRVFTRRLEEFAPELISQFKQRWQAGDPVLVRYISKRYASVVGKATAHGQVGYRKKDLKPAKVVSEDADAVSEESSDESDEGTPALKDKNAKRQREYARKQKERSYKGDVKAGRRSKQEMTAFD